MDRKTWLRHLPKVDDLLEDSKLKMAASRHSRALILESVREALENQRNIFLEGTDFPEGTENVKDAVLKDALRILEKKGASNLRPVINATGVVLHTNLGRALLCESAISQIVQVAGRYSTLEYNLETGKRGLRYSHIEEIICKITGAEAAFVVNNNAAAVLLALNTLSEGKEAIVSRGQLVEIGGSFRVPDVMRLSGAILREVGTTNKTHLRDYADHIHENTGLILKVHTSNYRIVGFSKEVPLKDLAELGREKGIPVLEDIGSGTLIDFSPYGMKGEPTVQDAVKYADVVTFSGDKMLGGPQAGIICGKKTLLDRMKKNPYTRAFRVDKMTVAALEATFRLYMDQSEAMRQIPTLRMLLAPKPVQKERALRLAAEMSAAAPNLEIAIQEGDSQVGGGSMPLEKLPTFLVAVSGETATASRMETFLRSYDTPIIARINEDKLLLDVRTILDDQFAIIAEAFRSLSQRM